MVNKTDSYYTNDISERMISLQSLLLWLIYAAFLSTPINASESLIASVDRDKVYLNESLTLKLTGKADIDFSFGGLMNFGRNQIEPPVIEGLADSFEILDRQQNYSMRSINGQTTTEVTWNYSLRPKRSGQLTIPEAVFKSAKSEPISIHVLEGKAPVNAENPPQVFIEVEVDKNNVYVQEQVKYTVRLFSLGRLSSGNLSEPETYDAIIEPFGEETKYYRMAYNQRYEVIERNYLLFPQSSGKLDIAPVSFNGVLIDSYKRRRVRITEMSDAISLTVEPPNPAFEGEHWLPTKSLHISESWQSNKANYNVGDAITREISVTALGLLGSALPPIPEPSISSVKAYPDKPIVESSVHEAGSQAFRKETTTYIALEPGTITLPEVSIQWWDTVNDVPRTATLPEKVIEIAPGVESRQLEKPTGQHLTSSNIEIAPTTSEDVIIDSGSTNDNTLSHGLLSIIALLLVGWACTSYMLVKKLRDSRQDLNKLLSQQSNSPKPSSVSLKLVIEAIRKDSFDTPKLALTWLSSVLGRPEGEIMTLKRVAEFDEELAKQLKGFEATKYSEHSKTADYNPETLVQRLRNYERRESSNDNLRETNLKPFYPQ